MEQADFDTIAFSNSKVWSANISISVVPYWYMKTTIVIAQQGSLCTTSTYRTSHTPGRVPKVGFHHRAIPMVHGVKGYLFSCSTCRGTRACFFILCFFYGGLSNNELGPELKSQPLIPIGGWENADRSFVALWLLRPDVRETTTPRKGKCMTGPRCLQAVHQGTGCTPWGDWAKGHVGHE